MDDLSQAVSDKLNLSKEDTAPASPKATKAEQAFTSAPSTKQHTHDPASIPSIVPWQPELWCHQFPRDRKMMVGTITATSPLPTASDTKLTYATHPHIIEQLLDYVDTNTLFAFRSTCRRLRDEVDLVFESHIELHMEGLQLVFETPARRVIKAQRIPRFYNPALHNIRLDVRPSLEEFSYHSDNRFDHHITNFAVHHTVADWFAKFLSNIKILDFHGGILMNILPGAPPRKGPDALGEVAVKSVKVPKLRFFPDGQSDCGFAAAVPFYADVVEYHGNLHLTHQKIDGSWLFWPKWVPQCEEVAHHVMLGINQKFNISPDRVKPFVYPPSVKKVVVLLCVIKPPNLTTLTIPGSTAEERCIPIVTLLLVLQRICGALQPGITWEMYGFTGTKLATSQAPGGILAADRVPNTVMLYLVRLQAAIDKEELKTDEDYHRKAAEMWGRVIFHGQTIGPQAM